MEKLLKFVLIAFVANYTVAVFQSNWSMSTTNITKTGNKSSIFPILSFYRFFPLNF